MKQELPSTETDPTLNDYKPDPLVTKNRINTSIVSKIVFTGLLIISSVIIINCSKTNTQDIKNEIHFDNLKSDYKNQLSKLVLLGKVTPDNVVFTIDKEKLLQGIMDDNQSYKNFFHKNTQFNFDIESVKPEFKNLNHIYLSARGTALEPEGIVSEFLVLFKLEPDNIGALYNLYTQGTLCKGTNCNHCNPDYTQSGVIMGCLKCSDPEPQPNAQCDHSTASQDKGGYFILPIRN